MPRAPARLAALYLATQASLVAAWWLLLWTWPAAREPFLPADWPEATLFAFVLPDVVLLVVGSLATAHALRRERPWARAALAALLGAVLYATLWCIGTLVATGDGWLACAMMAGSSAGTAWALAASAR